MTVAGGVGHLARWARAGGAPLGAAILLAVLLVPAPTVAGSFELQGQASTWLNHVRNNDEWGTGLGAGYIPQLTLMQPVSDEAFLDLEISAEALASWVSNRDDDTASVDLYRLKIRFATASTETRLGLQQINFGPAYLLRPLRWFDVLDPRDPQGLTDGVYALTLRYVTLGNSSFWLWGLYGNDEAKGYEMLPALEGTVEYGGRVQVPLLSGELGLSCHGRQVDGARLGAGDFSEQRLGLDGRWDVVVGAWLETAFVHKSTDELPQNWFSMTTLGTDYTFGTGNGLHTLLEHMLVNSSEGAFEAGDVYNITGVSLSYPLGYIDRLSAISFYSWDNGDYSQYAAWDHYWDRLALNVSLFYYPETRPETAGGVYNPIIAGGGYGGQVLLVFNH